MLEGQIVILSDRRKQPAWQNIDEYHTKFRELALKLPFFLYNGTDPIKDVVSFLISSFFPNEETGCFFLSH